LYCGFAKPELKQLEIDFHQNPEDLRKIAHIMACEISKEMAEKIAKTCWKEFVAAKNHVIAEMGKGKEIEDKGAYIVGILQNKGALERKTHKTK
jgi:hypothetical protein